MHLKATISLHGPEVQAQKNVFVFADAAKKPLFPLFYYKSIYKKNNILILPRSTASKQMLQVLFIVVCIYMHL